MFNNPTMDEIRRILTDARTVAVVGASSDPSRASHGITRYLIQAGYDVVPVNPGEQQVLGIDAVPALAAVDRHIDIVDVFRRSDATPGIAEEAVAVGTGTLWLQQGISHPKAAEIAAAGGLHVVMDACIAVMHSMLRIGRAQG